jgi:hypothetical protein
VPYRRRVLPSPETALLVVLARLAFPGRWETLSLVFGRSKTWLSTVFVDVTTFLAAEFGDLLRWHPQLTPDRVHAFADAIQHIGGFQEDTLGVWDFVDGNFCGFCRPEGIERQRAFYSGHKKAHGMKFQAIVTPDGLASSSTGPWPSPINN